MLLAPPCVRCPLLPPQIAVLKEMDGKGPFCSLVMAVVVVKDVVVIIAYAINVELIRVVRPASQPAIGVSTSGSAPPRALRQHGLQAVAHLCGRLTDLGHGRTLLGSHRGPMHSARHYHADRRPPPSVL